MTEERNIKNHQSIDDDYYFILNENINELDERKRHNWVRDDLTDKCLSCEKYFSIFRRRHHCRFCGGIFCYECSGYSIEIPKFIESCPKPDVNPYDFKNYIPSSIKNKTLETLGYNTKEDRVCFYCYKKINSICEIHDLVKTFSKIILDIPSYHKMAQVSKSWNKVAKFYLSVFKQIQFFLPDHVFSERECNLLWVNRKYLAGHSRWLIPLIKSINWKKISIYDKKEVIELLTKSKTHTCKQLMCSGHCNSQFSPEDSIISLYPYIEEKEVRRYIFDSLSKAPVEELLSYLPYMVYICRFYYNKVKNKCQISNFLIHLSTQNYVFLNYLYWELNLQCCDREYKSMYHNIKLKLLANIDDSHQENKEILINSYNFINNIGIMLEKNPNCVALKEIIKDHLLFKNYFSDYPIALPIQPQNLCIGVDIESIHMKDSATKPIQINFNCIKSSDMTNYSFSALFKKEDIRKDHIISKIILLMDLIIYRELGVEMNLINYAILPIDEKCGFVEIVKKSETIYHIHEKLKFSIQNYISEHNDNIPVDILRDRFVKSCAGYCVISYMLGLGDRHLDNIMITEDGYLFHIDYSYILGYDPKIITKNAFGSSEIRLTSDMIDMMGGTESKHYKRFKELCNQCYNCLRQHSNLFYILLSMLNNYVPEIDGKGSFSKQIIEKHIIDKFIPFENNYEARIHINTKLTNTTHESLGTSIIDFFHYYKKEGWLSKLF
jgi:hypothetical protein